MPRERRPAPGGGEPCTSSAHAATTKTLTALRCDCTFDSKRSQRTQEYGWLNWRNVCTSAPLRPPSSYARPPRPPIRLAETSASGVQVLRRAPGNGPGNARHCWCRRFTAPAEPPGATRMRSLAIAQRHRVTAQHRHLLLGQAPPPPRIRAGNVIPGYPRCRIVKCGPNNWVPHRFLLPSSMIANR